MNKTNSAPFIVIVDISMSLVNKICEKRVSLDATPSKWMLRISDIHVVTYQQVIRFQFRNYLSHSDSI